MTKYDVNYETDLRRKYLTPRAREKFDRWLNEIRAEAWDEGRQAEELGWTHAWDGHPAEPDEFCDECKVENPYRKG